VSGGLVPEKGDAAVGVGGLFALFVLPPAWAIAASSRVRDPRSDGGAQQRAHDVVEARLCALG
jgi:hypothetical protein